MTHKKLLINVFALAVIGAGISACTPAGASAGHVPGSTRPTATGTQAGTGSLTAAGGQGAGAAFGPGAYLLQAMPAGTVAFERAAGHLQAHVQMIGLTPGSAHDVAIDGLGRAGSAVVRFPALTADSAGQVNATLSSASAVSRLLAGSRFVVRLGTSGGDPMAGELIAETGLLPVNPDAGGGVFAFHAVTSDADGAVLGQPAGRATIAFNQAAQTLTVSLTAYGLTPGAHAAHIHLGSCQNQGGVKYMLADFVANASGDIIGQTRVVTGVTSVPGPGNWYLNVHQGGMSQILANGVPTLYFRPMLCANITGFAMAGSSSAAPAPRGGSSMTATPVSSPSGTSASPVTPASPSVPASPVTSISPSTSASPSSHTSPSISPTGQPTHW